MRNGMGMGFAVGGGVGGFSYEDGILSAKALLSSFSNHLNAIDKDINVLVLGTSVMAWHLHTTGYSDAVKQARPPMMHSKNIVNGIHDRLTTGDITYARSDKPGIFIETGETWTDYLCAADANLSNLWDDDRYRPAATTTCVGTGEATLAFSFPATHKRLNFIYRTATDGSDDITVAIAAGNGKVEVWDDTIETPAWVEANGWANHNQHYADAGVGYVNSEYQRRLKFRKVTVEIENAHTITFTKAASESATSFNYWGYESTPGDYFVIVRNAGRSSAKFAQLAERVKTETENYEIDLVLIELPILNDKYLLQTTPAEFWDMVNTFIFTGTNSLKNLSNNWTDFKCIAFMTHDCRSVGDTYFVNEETGTWQPNEVDGISYISPNWYNYTRDKFRQYMSEVPYIDVFTKFNEYAVANYESLYVALTGNGTATGSALVYDLVHPNDNGVEVILNYLLPIFTITRQLTAPTITAAATPVTTETNITMACINPAASIYYTTNGTTPTAASTKYTAAIQLNEGTITVKAIAIADNGNWLASTVTTEVFDVQSTIPVLPDSENIVLWAAMDLSTITKDGSDLISAISDISGSENHLTAASGKEPTYVADAQNGLAVARFDGTDNCMVTPAMVLPTGITLFVAVKTTDAKAMFIEQTASATTNNGFFFLGEASSTWYVKRGASTHGCTGAANWLGANAAVATFAYLNPPVYYKNKTAGAATITGTALTGDSANAVINIFSRNQASLFSQGYLMEIILYDTVLSTTDIATVQDYLIAKWGIT